MRTSYHMQKNQLTYIQRRVQVVSYPESDVVVIACGGKDVAILLIEVDVDQLILMQPQGFVYNRGLVGSKVEKVSITSRLASHQQIVFG